MTPIHQNRLNLRTLLFYGAILMVTGLIIGYTLFQARFILSGPLLTFSTEAQTIQTDRVVTLKGSARNIVKIALNGRQIYTDKSGHFEEMLVLENGYTVATLEAQDRYGRVRQYTKEFVYLPATEVQAKAE